MHISKKNIWQMLAIIVASIVCGLTSNFIAEKPLPPFKALAKPDPVAGAISFAEADSTVHWICPGFDEAMRAIDICFCYQLYSWK